MARTGRIATFYSYKGGTGRSMALANFAWILAASGKKVLAIDWDLEAPGLHRYFRPFLVDQDLFETDGLIDAFWSFTAGVFAKTQPASKYKQEVENAQVLETLEDATRRLDSKFFPKDVSTGRPLGFIDFIGAGRQGSTYSERVNSFDWKKFYDLGGAEVLSAMKEHLQRRYDWILIDSRTGVSDTSGICTIQMPETVVAFFTLNRQSIDGLTAILHSIRDFRSSSVDGSKIEFFPIATRIENAEHARLQVARRYARNKLADFLPKQMEFHPRTYWDKMEISYRPSYAFEEVLAAFGDPTGAEGAADTMLSQVEATAQQISGDDDLRMPEIVERDRNDILTAYYFAARPEESEVADEGDFPRQVRKKEQLWRTSKFDWHLLLSRSEIDRILPDDLKSFGRNMTFYYIQSKRMLSLLRKGQVIGSGMFFLVFVLALIFSFLFPSEKLSLTGGAKVIIVTIEAALIAAWTAAALARAIVSAVVDKPHGLRITQIAQLAVFGPFGLRVHDFDPDKNRLL